MCCLMIFKQVDIVVIVIALDRLLENVVQSIKKMLNWLNYKHYSQRFVFVLTKSPRLTTENRKRIKNQLKEKFNLSDEQFNDDAILFTDFPNSEDLTSNEIENIRNDFKELNYTIFKERQSKRILIKLEDEEDKGSKQLKQNFDII